MKTLTETVRVVFAFTLSDTDTDTQTEASTATDKLAQDPVWNLYCACLREV